MLGTLALGWAAGAQGFVAPSSLESAAPESKRLSRAKDLIADEQWARAIDELRPAVADSKEPRRDEALYWLAHSLNQSGDQAAAVETIGRLEREFPSSMWVKPARSLRIEIAVRLNRSDVLWWTALPPSPPAVSVKVEPRVQMRMPKQPAVAPPPKLWYPDKFDPDADLRIQALGALMKTDAEKVVPILGQIAFESDNPGPAMRAVFMLAQSSLPTARETVVRVAMTGPEPVRIAAVRDLGRFGGPETSKDLLSVYTTANEPVRLQIVKALGERADGVALLQIVESEQDGTLRFSAIAGLGQAGGAAKLARMYKTASQPRKRPIIVGLFRARADVELIQICDAEPDPSLRHEALERLRLLGTPKAKDTFRGSAKSGNIRKRFTNPEAPAPCRGRVTHGVDDC